MKAPLSFIMGVLSLVISLAVKADDVVCNGSNASDFPIDTPLGTLTFPIDGESGTGQYICLERNLLLAAPKGPGKDGYAFDKRYLNGGINDIEYQPAPTKKLALRIVVKQLSYQDDFRKYWLLDFRDKQPLVVGPFGECDASDTFVVHWHKSSAEIILGGEDGAQSYVYDYKKRELRDTSDSVGLGYKHFCDYYNDVVAEYHRQHQ